MSKSAKFYSGQIYLIYSMSTEQEENQDESELDRNGDYDNNHSTSTTMTSHTADIENQSLPNYPKSNGNSSGQPKVFRHASVYDRYLNKKSTVPRTIQCVHCSSKFVN